MVQSLDISRWQSPERPRGLLGEPRAQITHGIETSTLSPNQSRLVPPGVSFRQGADLLDFDFEPDAPEWSKQLAAFDLETTGLDLSTARIVTACIAVLDLTGQVLKLHEFLVDPGIEIPQSAADVHGITTEIARAKGSSPVEAIAEITKILNQLQDSMPLVAFNAPYDFTILANEARRYDLEPLVPVSVIDPLVLDRKVDKFRKGKRNLVVMAEHYGVELTDAHNSTADAVAAGRLAMQIGKKFPELNLSMTELHAAQAAWSDEQSVSFAEFMRKQNRPDFRAELGWPIKL